MRIVYIFKSIALLAGMERILTDRLNYLSEEEGFEIHLITYEQSGHPLAFPLNSQINHTDLNVKFYTTCGCPLWKRILMLFQMRKQLRNRLFNTINKIEPDIIITSTYSYPILDIIRKSHPTAKYILESHVSKNSILKVSDFNNPILKCLAKIYDSYFLNHIKRFNVLITLTDNDKKSWGNIIPIYTIPNSIKNNPYPKAELNNKKIISVGRLHKQKGFDLLIHSWLLVHNKYPDWEMHVYGDGEEKSYLENLINENNLQKNFVIHEPTSKIFEEYIKHSFYVMSSRYEGFGLVIAEAMNCGLPCISFNCPHGPSEIIKHTEDGILVENGNIEKLADAICYLIENENIRKEMGRKASKNIQRYSESNIKDIWLELFKKLK